MLDPFNPDDMGDHSAAISGPPKKKRSKAWIFWLAVAVILTVAIGAVIAIGINAPESASSGSVLPGVNEATASLLQLDTSPQVNVTAPAFSLTDQNGKPMTLTEFRGKSVVLTFNDDQCADLCTLLAADVLAANEDLGKAQSKIAFVSINANPYFPSPATVKQWTDQNDLGHARNWFYGTASPAVLSSLADKYGVPIELDAANKTVEHGTEIFFINPQGKELRLGEFGTESADTAQFGHAIAQVADDQLPAGQRTHVAGQDVVTPSSGSTQLNSTPAPVDLPELGNPATKLSTVSDKGKYTVMNFWASTCTACISEMPALEAEYRILGSEVAFIGIDVADKADAGNALATSSGISYPLLADANGATAGRFAISGLPYTVILDPRGKVVIRHPGALTEEQLDYLLRNLDMSLPEGN